MDAIIIKRREKRAFETCKINLKNIKITLAIYSCRCYNEFVGKNRQKTQTGGIELTKEDLREYIDGKGTKHAWIANQMGMCKVKFSLCLNGKARFSPKEEDKLYKVLGIHS